MIETYQPEKELRSMYLEIAATAAKAYKKYHDQKYLDYIKFFCSRSVELKKQIINHYLID